MTDQIQPIQTRHEVHLQKRRTERKVEDRKLVKLMARWRQQLDTSNSRHYSRERANRKSLPLSRVSACPRIALLMVPMFLNTFTKSIKISNA